MKGKIYRFDTDEKMLLGQKSALLSFKYFWRELSWENRRIVPGLDMHAIKVPIKTNITKGNAPTHEQMWFSNVDFDGAAISGELLNQPNWVKKLKPGDRKIFKLEEISDWIYALNGRAYGGFTVNAMRSSMPKKELKQHDDAWGLKFGKPESVFVAPKSYDDIKSGYQLDDNIPEHPMSIKMAKSLVKDIKKNPKDFLEVNSSGQSLLHYESLAGNLAQVKALLKCGANKNLKNINGLTPIELASFLHWDKIINVLR